jgi:YcxB-like protein
MTITYTVTKRAHWRALQAMSWRNSFYRSSVAFFCALPLLILGVALLEHRSIGPFIVSNPFTVFAGPLLALVGFPLASYVTVRSYHRNNRVLQTTQTCELTATHLGMSGPFNNAQLKWEAILRVVETRHSVLFYVGKNAAHFLPKDVLSPAQLGEVRARLTEWLPGRVQMLSASAVAAAA